MPVINSLTHSSKFTLPYVFCDNRQYSFKNFSFTVSLMLSLLSRGRWRNTARGRGFCCFQQGSHPAARVWGHLVVLWPAMQQPPSLAQTGSLDRHGIPGLLPTPGPTPSACQDARPLTALPVALFHWPPLHNHAPNHWLWLALQPLSAPGCRHQLPNSLCTPTPLTPSCSSPVAPTCWTPEGCFLLAKQPWTSSGPGKPVNFTAIRRAATVFSLRSEMNPSLGKVPPSKFVVSWVLSLSRRLPYKNFSHLIVTLYDSLIIPYIY